MTRKKVQASPGKVPGRDKSSLTLLRIDTVRGKGAQVVFDDAGVERSWMLEPASVVEIFALLLKGTMWQGRRVMLGAVDVNLEPPSPPAASPILCMVMGQLELCAPLEKSVMRALRVDIDRFLKRSV